MARRRKMDPERKAFINSLLEHYQPKDAQDIQDMLKDLLGETLEYSCAVTPQIRQMGNHLSGNAGTAYASLLA